MTCEPMERQIEIWDSDVFLLNNTLIRIREYDKELVEKQKYKPIEFELLPENHYSSAKTILAEKAQIVRISGKKLIHWTS